MEAGEEARRILDERSENELIAALLEASPQEEGLRCPFEHAIRLLDLRVQDAIEAYREIDALVRVSEPDEPQVCDDQ